MWSSSIYAVDELGNVRYEKLLLLCYDLYGWLDSVCFFSTLSDSLTPANTAK